MRFFSFSMKSSSSSSAPRVQPSCTFRQTLIYLFFKIIRSFTSGCVQEYKLQEKLICWGPLTQSKIPRTDDEHTHSHTHTGADHRWDWWEQPSAKGDAPTQINTQSNRSAAIGWFNSCLPCSDYWVIFLTRLTTRTVYRWLTRQHFTEELLFRFFLSSKFKK